MQSSDRRFQQRLYQLLSGAHQVACEENVDSSHLRIRKIAFNLIEDLNLAEILTKLADVPPAYSEYP